MSEQSSDRNAYTILAGIVSFGNGCAYAGYPGVYANVADSGIYYYIQNIIAATPPPQPAKTIEFQTAAKSVSKAGRTVALTVVRSSTSGSAIVRYASANGSAFAGSDYRSQPGTFGFKAGQSTASIKISIYNDKKKEAAETFTVRLSTPSFGWATGASSTATVTIIDND